jgi:5-aminopentanamidase
VARVAVFELPARWGDPERALADVEELLARGPATDLVLLPEQAITGYVSPEGDFDLAPFAEPLGGPTTERLGAIARARSIHLVAPLVERDGDNLYNAMIVFGPDGGVRGVYRKRHPWYVEEWASPADNPLLVVEVRGVRCAIAICFDVHFLAEESAAELRAADVLLFPSAWVEKIDTRPTLLSELASRFELAVVNANWGRGVPAIYGQGTSRIVGADGETLAEAPATPSPHRLDVTLRFRGRGVGVG